MSKKSIPHATWFGCAGSHSCDSIRTKCCHCYTTRWAYTSQLNGKGRGVVVSCKGIFLLFEALFFSATNSESDLQRQIARYEGIKSHCQTKQQTFLFQSHPPSTTTSNTTSIHVHNPHISSHKSLRQHLCLYSHHTQESIISYDAFIVLLHSYASFTSHGAFLLLFVCFLPHSCTFISVHKCTLSPHLFSPKFSPIVAVESGQMTLDLKTSAIFFTSNSFIVTWAWRRGRRFAQWGYSKY